MDASEFIGRMQEILEEKRLKSQRLTGAKLVDLLVRDAGVTNALAKALPFASLSRMQLMRVNEFLLAWCLCHRVVKLDFHFTPYSTIVYVVSATSPSSYPLITKLEFPVYVLEHKDLSRSNRKRPLPITNDSDPY